MGAVPASLIAAAKTCRLLVHWVERSTRKLQFLAEADLCHIPSLGKDRMDHRTTANIGEEDTVPHSQLGGRYPIGANRNSPGKVEYMPRAVKLTGGI